MKRSGPLRRNTPLKRGRRSYRTVAERDYYLTERDQRRRMAHGECEAGWHEACPRHHGDYTGVWMQAHHVRTSAKGGSDHHTNLRWVCEWCHNLIHARPNQSRERGLLE